MSSAIMPSEAQRLPISEGMLDKTVRVVVDGAFYTAYIAARAASAGVITWAMEGDITPGLKFGSLAAITHLVAWKVFKNRDDFIDLGMIEIAGTLAGGYFSGIKSVGTGVAAWASSFAVSIGLPMGLLAANEISDRHELSKQENTSINQ